MSSEPLC